MLTGRVFVLLSEERITLSKLRFEKARECLSDAALLAENESYKSLANRSYYAVFHAIRAVLALDGFDSKKHSGVIAEFQKQYIKDGTFDKEMSAIIRRLFLARNNSDYDDFFVIAKDEAIKQYNDACMFLEEIEKFLKKEYLK